MIMNTCNDPKLDRDKANSNWIGPVLSQLWLTVAQGHGAEVPHQDCSIVYWCIYLYTMEHSAFRTWHDDVIKWKHFPRYWPFVRGIPRSPGNSPHKGQWHGALIFSMICAWTNGWANHRRAGDLRRHRAHHDVTVVGVMLLCTVACLHIVHVTNNHVIDNTG